MDSVELCGLKVKLCWTIFVVLNAFALVFMLVTISVPNWVEVDDSEFDLSFKGSLYGLVETSTIFRKWEDESYSTAKDDWCDLEDQYSGDNEDFYAAGCTMFGALATFGGVFLAFETLSACYTIVNILGFCIFFCNLDLIWLSLGSVCAACFWHLIAFMNYAIGVKLNFEDKCDDFRDGDEPQDLCADDGPAVAIFLLFFMLAYAIFQCIFICVYYRQKKHIGLSWNHKNIKDIDSPVEQNAKV